MSAVLNTAQKIKFSINDLFSKWDQINWWATDLFNKCDDSLLIRWETYGPDIARIITEFEESEGKPLTKSAL